MTTPGRCLAIGWLLLTVVSWGCATMPQSNDPLASYSQQQLVELGEKFLAAGDTGQALTYLVRARQQRPNDPVIHYDLGLAYQARQMPEKAKEQFLKALRLKPGYAEAQNALGALYAEQGQLDEALRYFKLALDSPFYRTPQYAYYNIGRIYEQKNDLEAALSSYRRAVQIRSNYTPALYRMGKVLEALNRNAEALQAYGEAIHYTPDFAEAQFDYGRLSLKVGHLQDARNAFERVLDAAPRTKLAAEAARYLQSMQSSQ
jgi:type IV pilus assembly protein PilF